jgi:hypothetical protein
MSDTATHPTDGYNIPSTRIDDGVCTGADSETAYGGENPSENSETVTPRDYTYWVERTLGESSLPGIELLQPIQVRIEYADDGVVVGAPEFSAWEVGVTVEDGVKRLLLFLAEDFEHYLQCDDAKLTQGTIDLRDRYQRTLKLKR